MMPFSLTVERKEMPLSISTTFSAFYAANIDHVIHLLQRRYPTIAEAAEDIAQSTFLALWADGARVLQQPNPDAYLWACVHHAATAYKRSLRFRLRSTLSLQREAELATDKGQEEYLSALRQPTPSVEDTVLLHTQLEEVSLVLRSLPQRSQLVFGWNVAGYTYDEIAQQCQERGYHLTEPAVNAELVRIRAHLRHMMHTKRGAPQRDQWSRQYAACMMCGTTKHMHWAKGRCRQCYDHFVKDQRRQARLPKPSRWSAMAPACVDCGTVERKHWGLGRCGRCYGRQHVTQQQRSS